MAHKLKCWVKVRGRYAWEKKNGEDSVLVEKAPSSNASVVVGTGDGKEIANPKTLKKALKKAQSYMKKHDRC